jgi:hypothetical protein
MATPTPHAEAWAKARKAKLEAAYAVAKTWEGQEIVPVDWDSPDDVHAHPHELFDHIADQNWPDVTLEDLPVMAYVVRRMPLFEASDVAHDALGHEADVTEEAVVALQAALDAWSESYGYFRIKEGEIVRLDAERETWWAEYVRDTEGDDEADAEGD